MSSRKRDGLRDRWLVHVKTSKRVQGECRALLLVMAASMDDAGRVSIRRADLAAEFDVVPDRIKDRIGQAVTAGLLSKRGGGWKDHPVEYEAIIPAEGGATDATFSTSKGGVSDATFAAPKGVSVPTPLARYSHHLSATEKSDSPTPKVSAETPPIARAYTNATEPPTTNEPDLETSETTAQPPDDSSPISAGAGTAPHTAVHNTEISPGLGSAVLSEASTDPLLDEPRNECTQHPEWNPDQTCRACKRWLHDHDGWTYRQRIANSLTMARTAP